MAFTIAKSLCCGVCVCVLMKKLSLQRNAAETATDLSVSMRTGEKKTGKIHGI